MGGRLTPGMATASATVPAWVLPALDRIAAREGYPSRSRYIAALIQEAVARDRAIQPADPCKGPARDPEPTPEGDGP